MPNSLVDLSKNRVASVAFSLLPLTIALATVTATANQSWANPLPSAASSLLPLEDPLEDGKISAHRTDTGLSEVAESINSNFADSQTPNAKSNELDLAGVPIVGEMLNENGKFDWGMDIPVSFDFGNLIGNPVLIVGTDFPTD